MKYFNLITPQGKEKNGLKVLEYKKGYYIGYI